MDFSSGKGRRQAVCCIPNRRSDRDNAASVGDTHRHNCCYIIRDHHHQHNAKSTDGNRGFSMFIQSGPHGLHAIASCDITAGSIIAQCLPMAHSMFVPPGALVEEDGEGNDRRKRCARCFFQEGDKDSSGTRKKKFGRCSKCRVTFYCSRNCQADDWDEQHKLECQYYVKRRKHSPISSSLYATSTEEDAIPMLLRTFNSLRYLRDKSDATTGGMNKPDKDEEGIQQADMTVSCGPRHFSSLMASPETCAPDLSSSSAMSLAKDLMETYAIRGTSSKAAKEDSNEMKQSATQCIWGYSDMCSDDKKVGYTPYQAIQRTLNAFKKNNFGIVNSLHSPIGEGLYPCAALLNHSCYPNCILRYKLGAVDKRGKQKYNPPILQIIACRNILSGEELCHSYVDLSLCTRERQTRLLETHGFVCECARCTNNGGCVVELPKNREDWELWPLKHGFFARGNGGYSTHPSNPALTEMDIDDALTGCHGLSESEQEKIIQQSHILQQQANQCMVEGDTLGELRCLDQAIALYATRGKRWVSPFHGQLYSVRCSYLSALLADGRILQATQQCEHIVSFLAVVFSHVQRHPLLGLQLYTLGDLYSGTATMEDGSLTDDAILSFKQKAKLAYDWAKSVMIVTHGTNDPMVLALEDNLVSTGEG